MKVSKISKGVFFPLEHIGGKLFNLQRLENAGFTIPATYFIDIQQISNLGSSCSQFAETFDNLSTEMTYAVRSSALVEDNVSKSYAGMFDSYLNVKHEHLAKFVIQCAASTNNKRLKAYESTLHLEANSNICVIIQEMIASELSGVCFTAHPTLKDINLMIIELGIGLGDKIVSGEVSPVTLILDKRENKILEFYLGDFEGFDIQYNLPMIIELANICKEVEVEYGTPVDIEWAFHQNNLFLLQARPITNLGQRVF